MRSCLLRRGFAATVLLLLLQCAAAAQDALKIAIGQRGGWEQCVSELGQNAGIFKKHGLALELLYTQGSGETIQIVLSSSVDVGIGPGTHAVFGAFSKGAPIRMMGASFTGARDQLYYVRSDSSIRDMKDAEGKTIAISTSGSSSHMLALALARHFGVSLVPQATGNYSATLTQVMTKQVDIGFAQAPFVLDAVEDGRIRLVAKGADMPEVQNQSIRAWIVHANTLERRRDALARYVTAYRGEARLALFEPRCRQGLCCLVGPRRARRSAGARLHHQGQHRSHSHRRARGHDGGRGEVQIYPRPADPRATRRAGAGAEAKRAMTTRGPRGLVRPAGDLEKWEPVFGKRSRARQKLGAG
jgi:NitT/TauT family transport system substrate-binding protein